MAIDVKCPGCGKPMRFSDRVAGKRSRCPKCEAEIRIPAPAKPTVKTKPIAEKTAAPKKLPVRETVAAEDPGPVISTPIVSTGLPPATATSTRGRVGPRRAPPKVPWALVGVASAIGLLALVVALFSFAGSDDSSNRDKVAQTPKDRKGLEDDEEIIILGEEPSERPKAAKKDEAPDPKEPDPKEDDSEKTAKKDEAPAETPKPEEPKANPRTVAEPIVPEPAEPVDPEPVEPSPKPIPAVPIPEEPPREEPIPAEPAPTEPIPEEPPEKPPAPPDDRDQTKVDVITIGPSPKPPAQKPPETTPKKPPADKETAEPHPKRKPKPGDEVPPVVAGPVDPNCPVCRGLGKVPLAPFQPYVHVEGTPAPKPEQMVFRRFCPKCQQGHDAQVFVDAEAARLKAAGQKHRQWEQKTTWQLVRVENHLVTIHAQLEPAKARDVGKAIELMAKHLQELTGSMELTVTRSDNYEMLILWEKQNYARFLDLMEPEWMPKVKNNWAILKQVSGSTIGQTSFFRKVQAGPPATHMGVNMAAKQQIVLATSRRAPVWLREGFAAYCENIVLGKNLVHAIDYEFGNLKLSPDWKIEMRRLAMANQLKPWQTMFLLELRDYQAPEHITSFSMVAYLIQTQPKKFLDLIRAIGQGKQPDAALAETYGKPVEKLQADWFNTLTGRRG